MSKVWIYIHFLIWIYISQNAIAIYFKGCWPLNSWLGLWCCEPELQTLWTFEIRAFELLNFETITYYYQKSEPQTNSKISNFQTLVFRPTTNLVVLNHCPLWIINAKNRQHELKNFSAAVVSTYTNWKSSQLELKIFSMWILNH